MINFVIGLPFIDIPSAVSVIGGVAGVGFAIWRGKQMKSLVRNILEFVQKYRAAKADGEISATEMDILIDELQEITQDAISVYIFWKKS